MTVVDVEVCEAIFGVTALTFVVGAGFFAGAATAGTFPGAKGGVVAGVVVIVTPPSGDVYAAVYAAAGGVV